MNRRQFLTTADIARNAIDRMQEREKGLHREMNNASDILAEALGYRHDETYGWLTGDHTVTTLAMEVRKRGVCPEDVD
jgi:hypothetical protein